MQIISEKNLILNGQSACLVKVYKFKFAKTTQSFTFTKLNF